jgi:hypothetical protein
MYDHGHAKEEEIKHTIIEIEYGPNKWTFQRGG